MKVKVPNCQFMLPEELREIKHETVPYSDVPFLWQGVELEEGHRYAHCGNTYILRYYLPQKCWVLIQEGRKSKHGSLNWRDMKWMHKNIHYIAYTGTFNFDISGMDSDAICQKCADMVETMPPPAPPATEKEGE